LRPDTRRAARWCGLALAGLGLLAIAVVASISRTNLLASWILSETLAPARVLPLLALGAAFALVGTRAFLVAPVLFALGVAGGLFAQDRLLGMLDTVPRAATHMFLTGPISYLAAGIALVASARWRNWLTPPAAAVFGAMLELTIRLTDPSLHQPVFTWLPLLIAVWIMLTVTLCLHGFWRGWFAIFGRIFGSWMLAIGLLYGGVSVIPKSPRAPPTLPRPTADVPLREP
jgi:hypothetical protein